MADYVKLALAIQEIGKASKLSKDKLKQLREELSSSSESLTSINAVTNALANRLDILDEIAKREEEILIKQNQQYAKGKAEGGKQVKTETKQLRGSAEDVEIKSIDEYRKKALELLKEITKLEKEAAKLKTQMSKIDPTDSDGLEALSKKTIELKVQLDKVYSTLRNINLEQLKVEKNEISTLNAKKREEEVKTLQKKIRLERESLELERQFWAESSKFRETSKSKSGRSILSKAEVADEIANARAKGVHSTPIEEAGITSELVNKANPEGLSRRQLSKIQELNKELKLGLSNLTVLETGLNKLYRQLDSAKPGSAGIKSTQKDISSLIEQIKYANLELSAIYSEKQDVLFNPTQENTSTKTEVRREQKIQEISKALQQWLNDRVAGIISDPEALIPEPTPLTEAELAKLRPVGSGSRAKRYEEPLVKEIEKSIVNSEKEKEKLIKKIAQLEKQLATEQKKLEDPSDPTRFDIGKKGTTGDQLRTARAELERTSNTIESNRRVLETVKAEEAVAIARAESATAIDAEAKALERANEKKKKAIELDVQAEGVEKKKRGRPRKDAIQKEESDAEVVAKKQKRKKATEEVVVAETKEAEVSGKNAGLADEYTKKIERETEAKKKLLGVLKELAPVKDSVDKPPVASDEKYPLAKIENFVPPYITELLAEKEKGIDITKKTATAIDEEARAIARSGKLTEEYVQKIDKQNKARSEQQKLLAANVGSLIPIEKIDIGKQETVAPSIDEAINKSSAETIKAQLDKIFEASSAGTEPAKIEKIKEAIFAVTERYKKLGITIASVGSIHASFDGEILKISGSLLDTSKNVHNLRIAFDEEANAIDRARKNTKLLSEEQSKALESGRFKEATRQAQLEDPSFRLKRATFNVGGKGSGVTQLHYQTAGSGDLEGVTKNMSLSVNKYGQILIDTTRKTRTFAQGVARDTIEMAKWGLAMGIIYTPLRKLQELMQVMITNEALLADATITIADETISLAKIFEEVSIAANGAGESITGVIEGFTLAYRATGNLGGSEERMAIATKLMSDSLVLSKISTLDQATAIDTLAASLRQTGMSLDQGTVLLDKWVKTTKVANVDLATLATGFAVLGDSADTAGLSVDELNGLMASIAETGIAGSREAAAQARAIVSGFQSDKASKTLQEYGIAVRDLRTKELRPFMDVMTEIYTLGKAGVLSKSDLADITLALGGGTRRQAVYSAFLENLPRVQQVAAESAMAHGDAQDALAKELDTVQTSITRLGNSFQYLAQTLGEDGGLLTLFQTLLDISTGIVKVFTTLGGLAGKAGPILAIAGVAKLYLGGQTDEWKLQKRREIISGAGSLANTLTGQKDISRYVATGEVDPATGAPITKLTTESSTARRRTEERFSGLLTANRTKFSTDSLKLGALSALPAIVGNIASDSDDKWARVGADIGGGIAGFLLSGGNPIGVIIGQSIGESFLSVIQKIKIQPNQIGGYTPEVTEGADDRAKTEAEKKLDEARSNLYKLADGTEDMFGRWMVDLTAQVQAAIINAEVQLYAKNKGIEVATYTAGQYLYETATPEQRAAVDTAEAAVKAQQGVSSDDSRYALTQKTLTDTQAEKDTIAQLQAERKAVYLEQLNRGEINATRYTEAVKDLNTFSQKATGMYITFGAQLDETSQKIEGITGVYLAYLDISQYGSQEEQETITQYISTLRTLDAELERLEALGPTDRGTTDALLGETKPIEGTRDTLTKYVRDYMDSVIQDAVIFTTSTVREIEFNKLELPSTGSTFTSEQEAGMVLERARAYDQLRLGELGLDEGQIDEFQSRLEDLNFVIKTEGSEALEISFKKMSEFGEKVSQEALNFALETLEKEGKLKQSNWQPPDFTSLDITMSEYNKAMQDYWSVRETLVSRGYQPEEGYGNELIQIFKDGSVSVSTKDHKIEQYLLQRLVDLNQKQLDGQYNIPDGATFYVPLDAAKMHTETVAASDAIEAAIHASGAGIIGGIGSIPSDAPPIVSAIDSQTATLGEKLDNLTWKDNPHAQRELQELEKGITKPDLTWKDNPHAQRELQELDRSKPAPFSTTPHYVPPIYKGLIQQTPQYGWGSFDIPKPSSAGILSTQQQATAPVAKVDFKLTTNTQMFIDGKVAWNAMRVYAQEDITKSLSKANSSFGTLTKNVSISM